MYFLLNLAAKPHQIRRHVMDGILAVKDLELSSAGPRINKKTGLVYPVPPTLSFLLDNILASCFNSPNSQARIRRKNHVRLTSTRRVVKRGYAASYFNSQSIGARIRYHPISSTDTFLILSVAPSATYRLMSAVIFWLEQLHQDILHSGTSNCRLNDRKKNCRNLLGSGSTLISLCWVINFP